MKSAGVSVEAAEFVLHKTHLDRWTEGDRRNPFLLLFVFIDVRFFLRGQPECQTDKETETVFLPFLNFTFLFFFFPSHDDRARTEGGV